ncbi:hypothetical protein Tco_0861702 [Tanacetum coccineum]|uniref:Uncharacterized protein n=1 Tax=Tanacetum coccineum TaxID=301880 RepID=A0ABQ5BIP2_9ASTR
MPKPQRLLDIAFKKREVVRNVSNVILDTTVHFLGPVIDSNVIHVAPGQARIYQGLGISKNTGDPPFCRLLVSHAEKEQRYVYNRLSRNCAVAPILALPDGSETLWPTDGPELLQEKPDKDSSDQARMQAAQARQSSYADRKRNADGVTMLETEFMLQVSPWNGSYRSGSSGASEPEIGWTFQSVRKGWKGCLQAGTSSRAEQGSHTVHVSKFDEMFTQTNQ